MNEAALDFWLIVAASLIVGFGTHHWYFGIAAICFGLALKPDRVKVKVNWRR